MAISESRSVVTEQQKQFQAAIAEQRKEFEALLKQQDVEIQRVNDRIELSEARSQIAAHNQFATERISLSGERARHAYAPQNLSVTSA
jgi:hypothetical protein